MTPHSSTLAWKIPWTEEPGGLQSMRSLRVEHDWATSLSLFTFTHWRRKWQPTPVFLPGESQGRGSLVGCRTRLKWLSSSSSSSRIRLTVSWLTGGTSTLKNKKTPSANAGDLRDVGLIPDGKDLLEEGTAAHSSILPWRISWTEEPSGLCSIGLQKVGHH